MWWCGRALRASGAQRAVCVYNDSIQQQVRSVVWSLQGVPLSCSGSPLGVFGGRCVKQKKLNGREMSSVDGQLQAAGPPPPPSPLAAW
jgi:hypothetical protein